MRRRTAIGLSLCLAIGLAAGLVFALVRLSSRPLPMEERERLLSQAGLPNDFPIHPRARREPQPKQGGFAYTLAEPVPDVLEWQNDELLRGGYVVFDADVYGQDDYFPHWLYFKTRTGTEGAIIIRPIGIGAFRSTEVKVLSTGDARLAQAPLPSPPAPATGAAVGAGSSASARGASR